MKNLSLTLTLLIASTIFFYSCDEETIEPGLAELPTVEQKANNKGGKGKKNDTTDEPTDDPNDPSDDPTPPVFSQFFQVVDKYVLNEPLDRFSISEDGGSVLLLAAEDDPRGVDYFGIWSDPFAFINGQVNYKVGGLTEFTYIFEPQADNSYLVTLNYIRRDEFSFEIVENTTEQIGIYVNQ